MIPFFRKIRKKMADDNKPMKYIRYAIGEVLLVVIGILIALSINNWNEQESEIKVELSYMESLIEDLRTDTIFYSNYKKNNLVLYDIIDSLVINLKRQDRKLH